MIKIIKKDSKVRIAKGLSSGEFACKCKYNSCGSTIYSKSLAKAFDKFRKMVGVSLVINSGYRCIAHNFDVGGKSLSRHTTGEAVDISLKTLNHLTRDDIEHAAKMAGFTFIKFYKTFVHMDVR